MVMVISFFKKALSMDITTSTDLLFFALAVLLIALSSYLLHLQSHTKTTLIPSKSSEDSE
jgi:hypothetical protein